jgi:hypothetical protein
MLEVVAGDAEHLAVENGPVHCHRWSIVGVDG